MKLKCIGGMADGQLVTVHDNYRVGDTVKVAAKIEFIVADFNPQDAYSAAVASTPHYAYKVCVLKFRNQNINDKLNYLIPYNWHEWEAIQHLLASHHATT